MYIEAVYLFVKEHPEHFITNPQIPGVQENCKLG